MKVAVISHAYQDERYLAVLDALAHDPDVEITLIHPRRYKRRCYRWNQSHPIVDVALPIVIGSHQGAFFYSPWALAKALSVHKPDLILHEQEVYALGSVEVAFIAWALSIPLVHFVWENVDRALCLPRKLTRSWVLMHTAALIAGSERARLVHQRWGYKRQIEVMPQMGVETNPFGRMRMHSASAFKICFVGRLEACKGVDCLLRALALLRSRGCDVKCAIAGEGPERTRLAAHAAELGISALVEFRGQLQQEEVRELLRSSDVLVLPSRRTRTWEEQFGLVLAEAMTEGTVAVGSDTGAIREVIGSPELLFPEDEAEALATVLERLHADPEFSLLCRFNLWKRAQDRFAVETVANRKVSFLRSLCGKTGTELASIHLGAEITWRPQ
jgi:glycosyltransferase involved in cell wall biosynthesis